MPRDPKARRGRGRGRGASEASADGNAAAMEWRKPRKWKRAESVEDWRKKELERLNCTKYHYLKFVEKQKVERRLKSCKRQLVQAQEAGKEEEVGELQKQLRSHLADHEYITYYPKHLPYNSLFPAQDSEASQQRRAEIRRMIREQLAQEGTEAALDALVGEPQVSNEKKGEVQRKAPKVKPQQQQQQPQQKKKKKPKQREELKEEPLAESPVGETGATSNRKPKKRRLQAKPSEEPAKAAKEEAARKKPLKQPKRKAQKAEEPSAKPAKTAKTKSSKGSKSSTAADGDGGLHPSWNAKKAAKVSGALVQAAGDRKVFDSDSDA